MTQLKSDQANS